jgi:hypothetical protein
MEVAWQYEPDQAGIVRPDGLQTARNRIAGGASSTFLEVDLSHNRFDKPQKYLRLYESEAYEHLPWAQGAKKFPAIMCMTERPRPVSQAWEGSPFSVSVFRIDQIREEVRSCLQS